MSDLSSLARSLHVSQKFTPAQIPNRTGFLDSTDLPFIALETITGWLAGNPAPLRRARRNPTTHLFPPISISPN